jgi:hypothetical protein
MNGDDGVTSPNDRMLRWDEETGAVGVFRRFAGHTNGNTLTPRAI